MPDEDDDNDGVTDSNELALSICDLDPLVDSGAQIPHLRDSGFFLSNDMQALALGHPVLSRNPTTGHFELHIGIRESPTLRSWSKLTNFSVLHNPTTHMIEVDIPPTPADAMFYQVFGQEP